MKRITYVTKRKPETKAAALPVTNHKSQVTNHKSLITSHKSLKQQSWNKKTYYEFTVVPSWHNSIIADLWPTAWPENG